jgi:hypothetical protein
VRRASPPCSSVSAWPHSRCARAQAVAVTPSSAMQQPIGLQPRMTSKHERPNEWPPGQPRGEGGGAGDPVGGQVGEDPTGLRERTHRDGGPDAKGGGEPEELLAVGASVAVTLRSCLSETTRRHSRGGECRTGGCRPRRASHRRRGHASPPGPAHLPGRTASQRPAVQRGSVGGPAGDTPSTIPNRAPSWCQREMVTLRAFVCAA